MPLIIRFTGWNSTKTCHSYSKENFERNQLLDGSISLSPLYPNLAIDLHVRTACRLPPAFPLASSCSGIVHHLSGRRENAPTQILCRSARSANAARTCFAFTARSCFHHKNTRTFATLLGPCFKTGGWRSFCLLSAYRVWYICWFRWGNMNYQNKSKPFCTRTLHGRRIIMSLQ